MKNHQSLETIQAVLHSGNDYRSGKKIILTSKNKRAALEPKWRSIPGSVLNYTLLALVICVVSVPPALAQHQPAEAALDMEQTEGQEVESHSWLRLGRQASWLFRSFLRDESDDATTLGLEFESYLGVGAYEVKNISYFEVAKYDRGVPGQPPGNPVPGVKAADGITDLLTAFWISKKGAHHSKHHFSFGMAAQFPTASHDSLGSGKYSVGPSFDYEYENGRIFAGTIALQIWSFAGDEDRKDVSMLMLKPFFYYSISEKWDLMYVPYGIQVYWNKSSGEKVYLPVGGGVQRHFQLGSTQMNVGVALYNNVVRPTNGTVWDLRFLVEFNF